MEQGIREQIARHQSEKAGLAERLGSLHEGVHIAGRAARSNRSGRFEQERRIAYRDDWVAGDTPVEDDAPKTRVVDEPARHIITRNTSPDIPFDRSINPYRGCEHGCIYCFARPSHGFMGLSAGLDFETRLFAKPGAAELLRKELARPSYKPAPIAMGTNTDPYQPVERERGITRSILSVLLECRHPITIVTKSRLVVRDLDILKELARHALVKVAISVTTLDRRLARSMEPRASTPQRRLDAIRMLREAGVPTGVMVAPVIPGLTDHELENIVQAAAHAGAVEAGYIPLRLPGEVAELFEEWLKENRPERAARVLSRVRAWRGGKLNDPKFGSRMRGSGVDAMMLKSRFHLAVRRAGLVSDPRERFIPRSDLFDRPAVDSRQLRLI